ncbi:hypothetical protein PsorP6_002715 [Peronosclerospora sorghi]|uniref:Uncharacterized protein n=1 Tax=Peronosclerospora sorghi TaxID=230839 RepID=A0ACC0WYL9_9STRA|nr:hypothetical protein PsorP6_002715 [Peronosclerospora sorghi]
MASRYSDEFRGRGRDRSRDRGYSGGGGSSDRGYSSRSSGGAYGRDRTGGRRSEQSGGGAEHLARIHGTEEDRVNCPFYFKIGACRHGDRCSRLHNKPVFSQTILVSHMYQNPIAQVIAQNGDPASLDQRKVDEEFEDFYEEIFEELCKFGKLEELNICDNLGDHLVGNVYAKYEDEEHAAAAQKALYGRFYAGRPLILGKRAAANLMRVPATAVVTAILCILKRYRVLCSVNLRGLLIVAAVTKVAAGAGVEAIAAAPDEDAVREDTRVVDRAMLRRASLSVVAATRHRMRRKPGDVAHALIARDHLAVIRDVGARKRMRVSWIKSTENYLPTYQIDNSLLQR